MKRITVFFTSALLVCIATFVVFAFTTNHNRDVSYASLAVAQPPDNALIGGISDKDGTGTDSEGPLWSTASAWFGFFIQDGSLRCGASGYAYVACYSSNIRYETLYDLYAKVPELMHIVSVRDPATRTRFGTFYDSITVTGEANGNLYNINTANPEASVLAKGENPSNNDTHNTSSSSPTPSNARDFEIICDACNDSGCSLCSRYRY